jgi:hypothetical protein
LGITYVLYYYGESEPSDNKDERHIDRVVVDKDVELIKLVNQYMTPFTFKFEVVNMDDQYGCNDWADSHRHSSLLVAELEVRKRFRDQFECVNAVKWRHIKNSLWYKVLRSTKSSVQLQCV